MNEAAAQPLPWHTEPWRRLIRALADQRMAHALLLVGPQGMGKRHFAQLLVRALLCQQTENPADLPCGRCHACHMSAAGTHPDFMLLTRAEDSKMIRVDDARLFVQKLFLTAQQGGRRVGLIDPADAMNASAANSLLKSLEEPPPGRHLLLVADRLRGLPATIRSRCQILRFGIPDPEQTRDWLQTHSAAAAEELAQAAGAPFLALQRAADGMPARRQRWITDLLSLCRAQASPLRVAASWQQEDLQALLAWLQLWLTDMLRFRLGGSVVHAAQLGALEECTAVLQPETQAELARMLPQWRRQLETQVNPQLLLENLLASWYQGCQPAGSGGPSQRRR